MALARLSVFDSDGVTPLSGAVAPGGTVIVKARPDVPVSGAGRYYFLDSGTWTWHNGRLLRQAREYELDWEAPRPHSDTPYKFTLTVPAYGVSGSSDLHRQWPAFNGTPFDTPLVISGIDVNGTPKEFDGNAPDYIIDPDTGAISQRVLGSLDVIEIVYARTEAEAQEDPRPLVYRRGDGASTDHPIIVPSGSIYDVYSIRVGRSTNPQTLPTDWVEKTFSGGRVKTPPVPDPPVPEYTVNLTTGRIKRRALTADDSLLVSITPRIFTETVTVAAAPTTDTRRTTFWLRRELLNEPRNTGPWVNGNAGVTMKLKTGERSEASLSLLMHTVDEHGNTIFDAHRPKRGDAFEIRTGGREYLLQEARDNGRGAPDLTDGFLPLFTGIVTTAPWTILEGGLLAQIQVTAEDLLGRLDEVLIDERWVTGSQPEALNVVLDRLLTRFVVPLDLGITWVHGDSNPNLNTLIDASVVKPMVFDYVPVSEAIESLVEQAGNTEEQSGTTEGAGGGVFYITPDKVVHSVPKDTVRSTQILLNKINVQDGSVSGEDDVQNLQTRTTVIGATTQAGERRDDFIGDGSTRSWQLRYRVDRIKNVSVDGVSKTHEGDDPDFTVDTDTGIISQPASKTVLTSLNELSVLYDWNFPIVETVTAPQANIDVYGLIHRVTQDASADSIERGQERAKTILRRNDNPTSKLKLRTLPNSARTFGNVIAPTDIKYIQPASIVEIHLPTIGVQQDDGDPERWRVESVDHRMLGGAEEVNIFSLELMLRDHVSAYRSYYRKFNRIVVPTKPEVGQVLETPGGNISREVLVQEGLRLPKPLGGRPETASSATAWTPIPGYVDVVLDGQILPSNLVEWTAMAAVAAAGQSGSVRLYNVTRSSAVGAPINISNTTPTILQVRRITLAPNLNRYRLEVRYTGPTTDTVKGVRVWGGNIDVGA